MFFRKQIFKQSSLIDSATTIVDFRMRRIISERNKAENTGK